MKKKLSKPYIKIYCMHAWVSFYGESSGHNCGLGCGLDW
jgi:hypothetical protein